MEQEQSTAKGLAAAVGTAKQQPQPDFRTQYKEATGKSQGAKAKPQASPTPGLSTKKHVGPCQHSKRRQRTGKPSGKPVFRPVRIYVPAEAVRTVRATAARTAAPQATSTSFLSRISTRAITNNGQPTRTHK
eukprot:2567422-Amphidinium_carterae.1